MNIRTQYLIKIAEIFGIRYGASSDGSNVLNNLEPYEDVLYGGLRKLLGNGFKDEDFLKWLKTNHRFNLYRPKTLEIGDREGIKVLIGQTTDYEDFIISPKALALKKEKEEDTLGYSHLLMGVGGIPNLQFYIFLGEGMRELFEPRPIGIQLAQDDFILVAFSHMYKIPDDDPYFIQEVSEFVNRNRGVIDKIRRLFIGRPKLLSGGVDGYAMTINQTMVFKIFTSEFAYRSAINAIKRLHEKSPIAKTEAMIYDAGILGDFGGRDIYYYVIEKMLPVGHTDRRSRGILPTVIQAITKMAETRFSEFGMMWDNDPEHQRAIRLFINEKKEEITNILMNNEEYRKALEYVSETNKLAEGWLGTFVEEVFYKLFTGRIDLHAGNVGINSQGYLRYFDPAYYEMF